MSRAVHHRPYAYRWDGLHGIAVSLAFFAFLISVSPAAERASVTVDSTVLDKAEALRVLTPDQARNRVRLRWRTEYATHYANAERDRLGRRAATVAPPTAARTASVIPASHAEVVPGPAAEHAPSVRYWQAIADTAASQLAAIDRQIASVSPRETPGKAAGTDTVPGWWLQLACGISVAAGIMASRIRIDAASTPASDSPSPADLRLHLPSTFFDASARLRSAGPPRWSQGVLALGLCVVAAALFHLYQDRDFTAALLADPYAAIATVWRS